MRGGGGGGKEKGRGKGEKGGGGGEGRGKEKGREKGEKGGVRGGKVGGSLGRVGVRNRKVRRSQEYIYDKISEARVRGLDVGTGRGSDGCRTFQGMLSAVASLDTPK